MAVEWDAASEEVLEMAAELIAQHHPTLGVARIGFLFRSEAGRNGHKRVLGQASKVTAKWQPLLDQPLDFIIWLAADYWLGEATPLQKRALLDHELSHCTMRDGYEPVIRPHDVEEFAHIIERYGYWRDDLLPVGRAFEQHALPFEERIRGHLTTLQNAGAVMSVVEQ